MTVAEYRDYAKLRVRYCNHALRRVPREKVTLHCCWGSFHGPHKFDIPLEHIADIIFSVKAARYSIRPRIRPTSTSGACSKTSNCRTARC